MDNFKTESGSWEHCSSTAVKRASRQLGQLYDDVLEPTGLRLTQFSLLSQIHIMNVPPLKALAEAIVMDLSALGHTLKPLIRNGLVELVPDERDRRVKRVRLTPLGSRRRIEAQALWKDAQARFDGVFGAEDSAALRRTLALVSSKDFAHAFKASTK